MKTSWRTSWLILLTCGSFFSQAAITSGEIDNVVAQAMEQYAVPGLVVGVVTDGRVIHEKSYGIREVGKPGAVNSHTLFKIASNTKAFTTAALAALVDEGDISWDDKVVEHLPAFKLADEWVTKEFTIIDLLTHRSGLGLGAGDLMLWPEPNHYTRGDIINALQHLQPVTSFRTQYAYDNLLYIVAGEVVTAVSGLSWEAFVDQKILKRIGAKRCFAGKIPDLHMTNLAAPHGVIDGELRVIERSRIVAHPTVSAAAGGMRCSLDDMLLWLQVQMAKGQMKGDHWLYSAQRSEEMWTPYTLRTTSERDLQRDNTHFKAYGLGWRLADVFGYKQVAHTGTLAGSTSMVTIVPELDVGVVVLTNGSDSEVRLAVTNAIVRSYMGAPKEDWVTLLAEKEDHQSPEPAIDTEKLHIGGQVNHPLAEYAGRYKDPWFGRVEVQVRDSALWFAAAKSPRLRGKLWPLKDNSFVARWEDRSIQGDAIVRFLRKGESGFLEMKMDPISDEIDFSFDYQDLAFKKVQD